MENGETTYFATEYFIQENISTNENEIWRNVERFLKKEKAMEKISRLKKENKFRIVKREIRDHLIK